MKGGNLKDDPHSYYIDISYSSIDLQFSVPQIEYPLGGSSKKGSHVYFRLIVAMENDSDNENTLFDYNIQIEITIYKQFK